jgi:hypothetical protein
MRPLLLCLLAGCGTPSGTTLATTSDTVTALFGSSDSAWFTTVGTSMGTLSRVPVTGGAAQTIATGLDLPGGVIVGDCASVYYDTSEGAIWAVPLAGGTPRQLRTGMAGELGNGRDLASDGANVWFITWSTNSQKPGALYALSTAPGSTPQKIAEGHFTEVAVFGNKLAVIEANTRIATMTLPNTTLTTLARLSNAHDLAIDGSFVYFVDAVAHRLPLAGGSPQDLLGDGGATVELVAADYRGAVLGFDRGIYSVDSGGYLTQIARAGHPSAIALSPAVVVWFDGYDLKAVAR